MHTSTTFRTGHIIHATYFLPSPPLGNCFCYKLNFLRNEKGEGRLGNGIIFQFHFSFALLPPRREKLVKAIGPKIFSIPIGYENLEPSELRGMSESMRPTPEPFSRIGERKLVLIPSQNT